MSRPSAWRAWRSQSSRRQRLAIEAGLTLARAKLVLATGRFAAAVTSGSIALGQAKGDVLGDLVWSIGAVGKRLWWRSVCLDRGLALQTMCRRRGIDALLHYGIGKDETDALGAHVWVSVAGEIILGGEQAAQFRCVAIYPGGAGQ